MDGRLIRILGALALSAPGLAAADTVNSEWYSTTATRSMGNIGIASAEDPAAVAFFNPAALARLKKPYLELINPQIDVGGDVFTLSHAIGDWGKHTSNERVEGLLKAQPGTISSMGFALFPNFSAQNLSFGVLMSGQRESYYEETTDSYRHHYRQLLIPSLGVSAALLGSRLRLGVAVRGIQITERDTINVGSTTPLSSIDLSRNGLGYGLDGGMLFTLPWVGLPTLGLVARNIGITNFPDSPAVPFGGPSTVRHEPLKMKVDSGFSFVSKSGHSSKTTFAIDYRDVLNSTGAVFLRKLNVGLEVGAGRIFFFRLGYSQATWTAGLGLNSPLGGLDLGTYGEELDPRAAQRILDRRYSLRFVRRF